MSKISAQNFSASGLIGENVNNPTSLDFGPNGKLYVSQQDGTIWELTISRDGADPGSGSYSVTSTSVINAVKTGVPNHNDDGTVSTLESRQVTGLLATGTSSVPVLYVSSSDPRIGGGSSGNETNLDTNSGILSRLTWTGSSWDRVDLVRGLPRCEENHSTNGMDIFQLGGQTYLLLQQGGNTNKGAPSNNFAGTSETYLSAAMLIINLTQLELMEAEHGGPYVDTRIGSDKYIYDLPTLNDPERADIDNSSPNFPYPPDHPMYDATIDLGDPFGGNNGLNQAFSEPDGPVQIFSPGYRNAYDVVVTANGRIYSGDNGPNTDWGGLPVIYNGSGSPKGDESTTTYDPGAGDYITNDFNESGSVRHGDALHYVGTINDPNGTYYAGHTVPIRAFPEKAGVINLEFDTGLSQWLVVSSHNFGDLVAGVSGYFNTNFVIGDFPDDTRQGEFLADEGDSSSSVSILDVVNSSTNGICEYTASNFGGTMAGDILTASFNGNINRYQLNAAGDGYSDKNNFFLSGFGSNPLDVIAQGDTDPFPGTIWAVTYGADNITVFEPADFGNCLQPNDPGYNPLADSDGDGYNNNEEVLNGTDHCNGGSKPNDYDGDFESDLLDTDDDNDGIPDAADAFALDPNNGTETNLPVKYPFWNNDPGTGFFGLGFTGLMINGTTDYLDQFNEPDLSFGGASGKASVEIIDEGDAFGNINTQNNAFQFGINVDSNSAPFTIHSELETPFAGITPEDNQSYGIFIGTGDQDNYLKFVIMDGVTNGDGINGFEVLLENAGVTSSLKYDVPDLLLANAIDIYINVNPSTNTALPYYSLDGGNTINVIGLPITLPIDFLAPNIDKGMAVGIISTSFGPGTDFSATWDFIDITEDAPADLSVTPDAIDFGTLVPESGIAQLTTVLQNIGGPSEGSLEVTDIAFSGADASLFSSTVTFPIQIGPGSNKTVAINFTPDNNAGVKSANMVITHSGANSPTSIPVTAFLSDFNLRINAGGSEEVLNGETYIADQFFIGGKVYINLAAQVPEIYKTERSASPPTFSYDIPLENGSYTVILHFAEIYWGATNGGSGGVGKRVFDVSIEGSLVMDNYDIYADVGAETAVIKSFSVDLSDGALNIDFSALSSVGGVDQPKISAIEIRGNSTPFPNIVVNPIAAQTNQIGENIASLSVTATGGDPNSNFTYIIVDQPQGIDIEPTNGLIYGTIANSAATGGSNNDGVHDVTVTVSKPGSLPVNTNFTWTVLGGLSCTWNNLSDANYSRFQSRNEILGDKIYVMGGWLSGINSNTHLEIYDITNDTWTIGADLLLPVTHMGSVVVGNDVWLIGGFEGNIGNTTLLTDKVQIYNTLTDTWSFGPDLPKAIGSAAATLNGNKIHYFGGLDPDIQTNIGDHYVLDLNNIAAGWTIAASMTNPRNHHSAETVNGIIYAIGGQLGHQGPKQDVAWMEAYNPDTDTWTSLTNLPLARSHFESGTTVHNGKIIIVGGQEETTNYSDDITQYDPLTNQWTELCTLPNNRLSPMAQVFGDKLIVSGGGINGASNLIPTTQWLQLEPEVSQFQWVDKDENENYTGRHECNFVQVGNKFYLLGGRESDLVQSYDYMSNTWITLSSAPKIFSHFQAIEYQGLIWVMGAIEGNNYPYDTPNNYIWIYNPLTDEWIQGPEIPSQRVRGSTGAVLYNDKFYIVGGNTNGHAGGYVNWFDEYDPATGVWTTLPNAPTARDHFHAVLLGDELYVVGGRQTGDPEDTNQTALELGKPMVAEVDVYDFSTSLWRTLPSYQNLPTPRAGASAVSFNNKLVVLGGEVYQEIVDNVLTTGALKVSEQFDPNTGLWSRMPDLNHQRHGQQALVSGNGIHVVAGSPTGGGSIQKNMEYYGVDNPVGTPISVSELTAPSIVLFDDGSTKDISLDVVNGDIGIWIRSMVITGTNASDFNIQSGYFENALMKANSSQMLTIEVNGTAAGRNATLTINYGVSSTLDIDLVEPLSCTWNNLSDANYSRFQSRNEILGDKIYVMGGWLSGINSNTHLEIYDITNDTWTIGADLLLPVTHMGSVVVGNDVWLIGGFEGNIGNTTLLTDKVQIYNTLTDTWSFGPDLPKAIGSAAATLNGNKIHYFGGLDPDIQTNIGDHYVLDLNNIAAGWTIAASMTNPRNHHSAETVNGIIYAIGGQLGHQGPKQDVAWMEAYNPDTDTWTSLTNLPLARSHFESGTTVHNGKIIIVGGQEETTNYSDDITQYDPLTNQWTELCTLPNNRLSPMAQVFGDKLIVSGGGINGASNLIPTTQWLQLETQTGGTEYTLSVVNGNGDGSYVAGSVVNISADAAPSGQEFDLWTGDVTSLADVNSASTNITMPPSNVSVTATYRAIQTTSTVWLEDFESLTNGTTVDNGATAWTSIRDSGTFEVSNGQFLTNGNSANPGVWTSEVIAISGTISISIDVDDADNNKEPADFVRAYYVLDGGPQVEFGSVTDDISAQSFTVGNISGSTLQIIVESDVSTTNEFYYIDNVTVFGEPTGATEYNLLVVNGNGDGLYQAGTQVDVIADVAPSGQEFDIWTGDITSLADVNSASTIITMPSSDVSVTATYRAILEYTLSVVNGNGDGSYVAGSVVNISADAAPSGQEFDLWTGDVTSLADVNSASTNITMPPSNVSVTATYRAIQTTSTVWLEDFESLTNGTTVDNGATAWTSIRDSGTFEVSNGQFLTNGNSANPGVWTSEVIAISGTISISIDVDDADNNKEPADFVRAYYVLDGGPQVEFGSVTDDISAQSFTVGNISGSTLQIIVESDVSTTNEFYYIDNVTVFGEPTGATEYNLLVVNGNGDGLYQAGTQVDVIADVAPSGQEFDIWTGDITSLADVNSASTIITMPSSDVSVTATYRAILEYTLSVVNGNGDGSYVAGSVVNISADAAPSGQEFDLWTGDVTSLADVNSASTNITMPPSNVSVTATYRAIQTTSTVWLEDFESLTNGTTVDNGATAWTSIRDSGTFEVSNGQFLTNGNSANPGVWTSEVIAISGTISISIDVDDADNNKEPADFVRAYYVLDGGPQVEFGSVTDDISAQSFTVGNISGSTLQIIVESDVSTTNEFYYIDNVTVFGEPTGATEYNLLVVNGNGDGLYQAGTQVDVIADVAPSGQEFDIWTGDITSLADVNSASTIITMPSSDVSVTATYRAILSDFDLRINSGGIQSTFAGNVYSADQFFIGGQLYTNTSAQLPELYQTERSSPSQTFAYNIPVTNGDYTVILHFAELYWGATGGGPGGIGQRIFDVSIEGSLVLDNYDINADVGPETIVTKSFDINVTDGTLNLDFSALAGVGGVDQPKISAIEIIGGGGSTAKNTNSSLIGDDERINIDINVDSNFNIQLYPNPTKRTSQVLTSYSTTDLKEIYLFDVTGRMVKRYNARQIKTTDNFYQLEVGDLKDGVYFVKLISDNSTTYYKKLVVKK